MNSLFHKIIDTFIITMVLFICVATFVLTLNIKKNQPLFTEKEFIPLLEEFKKDANKYKIVPDFRNMSTTFTPTLPEGVLAYCVPVFNAIKVSKEKWDELDDLSKKLLLYHEWGHCALKREHVTVVHFYSLKTCPESIMYPYIDTIAQCYDISPQWYETELFTNPNNRGLIPQGDS